MGWKRIKINFFVDGEEFIKHLFDVISKFDYHVKRDKNEFYKMIFDNRLPPTNEQLKRGNINKTRINLHRHRAGIKSEDDRREPLENLIGTKSKERNAKSLKLYQNVSRSLRARHHLHRCPPHVMMFILEY